MSCVHFATPAQRAKLARMASAASADDAFRHAAPPMTESKLRRLRLLAGHADPKIRESVAANRHTPPDVTARLACDPDDGVRAWLARNEAAPAEVLRELARDAVEAVRGWVALNRAVPEDVLAVLEADPSPVVRGLAEWRRSTTAAEHLVEA